MAVSDNPHLRLRAIRGRQVQGHADCSSASLPRAAATVTACSEAAAGTSLAGSHGHGKAQCQRMRHTNAVYRPVTPTNSATAAHRRMLCRCSDGRGSPGAAAWWCAWLSGCSSGAAALSRCSGIAVESPYLPRNQHFIISPTMGPRRKAAAPGGCVPSQQGVPVKEGRLHLVGIRRSLCSRAVVLMAFW